LVELSGTFTRFNLIQLIGTLTLQLTLFRLQFFSPFDRQKIEHHVWPDLSMKQYQKAAPRLKAICEHHGVPYVQESVFERLRKTVDIMVGKTTMRPFPTEYEPVQDKVGGART
jgi:hypothetical protein